MNKIRSFLFVGLSLLLCDFTFALGGGRGGTLEAGTLSSACDKLDKEKSSVSPVDQPKDAAPLKLEKDNK